MAVTDVIIRAGNMDLMAGMTTELRDENSDGKYTPYVTFTSYHTHTSTRTAAPPANLPSTLTKQSAKRARGLVYFNILVVVVGGW